MAPPADEPEGDRRRVPPPVPSRSDSAQAPPVPARDDSSSDEDDSDTQQLLGGADSEGSEGGQGDGAKASLYQAAGKRKKLPFYTPFLYRDYCILYSINVAEFFSSTLASLTLLQWLYEYTGSGLALGGLGIATLFVNVPGIIAGGVLADEMDRKMLVSRMQGAQLLVLLLVWLLDWLELMRPYHVYIAIIVLTGARRLEGSARGVLTAVCVPADVLPYAISYVSTPRRSEAAGGTSVLTRSPSAPRQRPGAMTCADRSNGGGAAGSTRSPRT